MLARLLLVLILAGLMAGAALWLVSNPGTISIDWMGWQVETSMLILLLALLLVFVLMFTVSAVFRFLFSLGKWRARSQMARRVKDLESGVNALTASLEAAAEGQIREGRRLAAEAAQRLQNRALAKQLAAFMPLPAAEAIEPPRAPNEKPALTARPGTARSGLDWWLRLLGQNHSRRAPPLTAGRLPAPSTPTLYFESHAGSAIPVAQAPSNGLPDGSPGFDWSKLAALVESRDWDRAGALIPDPRQPLPFTTQEARQLKAALRLAKALDRESADAGAALAEAREALTFAPSFMPALRLVARLLAAQGHGIEAAQMIAETCRKRPSYPLLRMLPGSEDPQARLAGIEAVLADRPENAEGQLALGEAAAEAKAWGRARRHLIASLKLQPSSKAYTLLATIEDEETQDGPAAERWRHKAQELGMDYGWHCRRCAMPTPDWMLLCPSCGGVNTVAWGVGALSKSEISQANVVDQPIQAP